MKIIESLIESLGDWESLTVIICSELQCFSLPIYDNINLGRVCKILRILTFSLRSIPVTDIRAYQEQ